MLNVSDFEPGNNPKSFLNTKGVTEPKKVKEYIPITVHVLPHHKTKQEFIICIDNAKVNLIFITFLS